MKKHQALIISLIVILAIITTIVIVMSKKSTEITPAPQVTETVTTEISIAPEPAPSPATFTMTEVATHNSRESCYTVVSGSVYDVTTWISQHPGGQFAILGLCGKDGTDAFTGKHGGEARPESELASFKIGTLVQ